MPSLALVAHVYHNLQTASASQIAPPASTSACQLVVTLHSLTGRHASADGQWPTARPSYMTHIHKNVWGIGCSSCRPAKQMGHAFMPQAEGSTGGLQCRVLASAGLLEKLSGNERIRHLHIKRRMQQWLHVPRRPAVKVLHLVAAVGQREQGQPDIASLPNLDTCQQLAA